MKKINPQKILAAKNPMQEGAKQMIESPMWFIEQILLKHEQAMLEVCKELYDERDALQKKVAQLHEKLDALLAHCDKENGECSVCAEIICDWHDPYHFHHDGCPSCAMQDSLDKGMMK